MATIGVPAETKDGERRVAVDPAAVAALTSDGHEVRVLEGAGAGAGFDDGAYQAAGAKLVGDVDDVWSAEIVVKVKEPLPEEWVYFHPDLTLFCYLHLAAEPALAHALVDAGVSGYAFETLHDRGRLPLLAPMSEVAGRAAAIVGAYHLASTRGGSGRLLGGAAGSRPARVVIVGLGVAGASAARGARGLEAEVTGVDVDVERLRDRHAEGIVTSTAASNRGSVDEVVAQADLVIGAALIPGARAPVVVSDQAVASMRPGSVVIDLAIDQGGCVETARPTSHSEPTFLEHEVVHYCVTNVPGQFAATASASLAAAVTPRLAALAHDRGHPSLAGSLNVDGGHVVHDGVRAALGTQDKE